MTLARNANINYLFVIPVPGTLNGLSNPVSVYVVHSSILKMVAAPHSFRNYMQGILTNTKEPPSKPPIHAISDKEYTAKARKVLRSTLFL